MQDAIEPQSRRTPFDGEDWLFEIKYDGFRAMAYVQEGHCTFVSRKNHPYRRQRFLDLAARVAAFLPADDCILDGELVCLDDEGHPIFLDLMKNRDAPVFAAFDCLWVNGEDIRDQPLLERKRKLEVLLDGAEHSGGVASCSTNVARPALEVP